MTLGGGPALRVWAALAACACPAAWAQAAGDWEVSGSNTARIEDYGSRGDPSASPYPFEGGQYYDEFNLEVQRRLSPYDVMRGQLYGVANDSAYRSPDHGLVPERVNLSRTKGDAPIPYRVEAGDVYAYFSYRTLQRSLKGVQLELQPVPVEGGVRQSIVIVAGANQPSWRHFQASDDWAGGLSWLLEMSPDARITANVLHDSRQGDAALGTMNRDQTVASVTGDYATALAGHKLRFEGELAGMHGDTDGRTDATGLIDPASGRDRHGDGVFAQVSGTAAAAPFDYRLRYERYDRDFQPAEGVVTADHRAEEAHAAWRFADGLVLRGRAQQFVDGLQSGNDLRTTTWGANLAGPFFAQASGSLDAFRQTYVKQDASIDRATWNVNALVSAPVSGNWVANVGLFWQHLDDRVPGASDTTTAQAQLGATRLLAMGAWSGSITPGITLRHVSGGSDGVKEAYPSLAFTLANGAHALAASYGYQRLRPDATTVATVDVNLLAVSYGYTFGRETVGFEGNAYDRHVTIGQFNQSYRVSLFWRHSFDAPPPMLARATPVVAVDAEAPVPHDVGALAAIVPGADFAATLQHLDAGGFRGGVEQGPVRIYETRLVPEVGNRQRLAIEHPAARVTRAALVIAIDDPGDAATVARTYEAVRKAFLDRYGNPSFTLEEGAISATLAADLTAGRIIRVMEWQTANGRMRLGIPRRLDGQVRIEAQHAAAFGPPRESLWSVDAVR